MVCRRHINRIRDLLCCETSGIIGEYGIVCEKKGTKLYIYMQEVRSSEPILCGYGLGKSDSFTQKVTTKKYPTKNYFSLSNHHQAYTLVLDIAGQYLPFIIKLVRYISIGFRLACSAW